MISHPERQSASRAPRPTNPRPRPRASPADTVALAARLTDRDRWITRMLHEHRVLTTNHLTALAFPIRKIALRRLTLLQDHDVVTRFRPLRTRGSAPSHWLLAPTGATVLAAEAGIDPSEIGYNHRRTLAIAHSLHLAHTLGVADWFTALTTNHHDGSNGGGAGRVVAWWSQTRCHRLWGDLTRPDAFGRYTHHEQILDFFLEYDLGSTSLPRVAAKLHGYSELARTTGVVTPVLLWVPTTTRETNARQALLATWRRLPDPDAVPVATAAAELLTPTPHPSPAAPVWMPLDTPTPGRLSLRELTETWPRRTPPAPDLDTDATPTTLNGQTMLAAPPPQPRPVDYW